MTPFQVFIILVLCFTTTEGQEQISIGNLLRRIEALELQGIEQRQLIDQQGKLLRRYEVKLKQYEDRLNEFTDRKEQQDPTKGTLESSNITKLTAEEKIYEKNTLTPNEGSDNSKSHSIPGIKNRQRTRLVVDSVEGPIAFHATKDKITTAHVGLDQHLLYEDVHLNAGNAFHVLHGLFIAPRAGVYIFSTSIMTQVSLGDTSASIEVNGVDVARAYANGNSGVPDQGSVTVVVQLKAGDEVWVKSYDRSSAAEYGDKFSSFMGCLIMDI